MTLSLLQRSALEALGTGFLAFTVGRLSSTEFNGFEQALSIGLCLALLIHLLGRFSGAHFNPAVTLLLNHQRFGLKAFTTRPGWLRSGPTYSLRLLVPGSALVSPPRERYRTLCSLGGCPPSSCSVRCCSH